MSSLKMTFSLTSLILIIALALVFVPISAMAHLTSTGVYADTDHDGLDNSDDTTPLTGAALTAETGHTHRTAPTVTGIDLVNVKVGANKAARDAMDATPTVSGSSVLLVDDVDPADDAANMLLADFTATGTGQFQVKITFSEAVYVLGQAENVGPPPATGETGFPANTDLADTNILDVAVSKAASTVKLPDAAVALVSGSITRDGTEGTTFLVTFTVAAGYADDIPMDVWLSVNANAVFSKGKFEAPNDLHGRGNAAYSMPALMPFTIKKMLDPVVDTTAPMMRITAPDMPDTDGDLVFRIDVDKALATRGPSALSAGDFDITGDDATATPTLAKAASVAANTAQIGSNDVVEQYMLTVTPDPMGDGSVMVSLREEAVADANGNSVVTMDAMGKAVESTMAVYDKTAPVVTITSAAGTGDDEGKVIFTIDFSEAPGTGGSALTIADLTVSNAPPLKVADLMMVTPVAPATLPTGVAMRYTLTITPTDATMANMLDLAGGSVADAAGNMADGVRHTYTPAATTPGTVDPGPPVATGQIGSKDYLVFVPDMPDPDALPAGIATEPLASMPDLSEFFSTGGTIDVAVKGKANHNVIITEIMVARDIGGRGIAAGVRRPAASQWIEIYNNTAAHINISDITVTFKTGFPADPAPADATDRLSNTVSGSGWGFAATFPTAVSGQSNPGATADAARTISKMFISLRRVYKDDRTLQKVTAADQILNGWLSSTWKLTASSRVYVAGRIGTPGSENRPTVFEPAVYKAPTMSVTFNEIANLSDNTNEWIELKGAADYNLRHHTIKMVTGYDKVTNTGTESLIYAFPTDADVKIPASGILLLTDKSPTDNKLEADLEAGVEKPARYRIVTLGALLNSGDFLLVLRDKDGANILDVAGHLTGLDDDDPYTLMWPLAANVGAADGNKGHISAKNKLAGGNVYKRARAIQGYLSGKNDGNDPAYEGAGFTGVGYDRQVSPANKEHHGTPGYPNNIQIGAGAEATDNVVISEIMYGDGTGNLAQWIEIQNRSDTNSVDLHNWKLYVVNHSMNADGKAFGGKVVDGIFLRGVKIPPRQTALVVSRAGQNRTNLPPHRILNLKRAGNDPLLSSKGFYLYLVANAHEGDLAKRQAGDAAGNLPAPKEVVAGDNIKLFNDPISTLRAFQGMDPVWELPAGENGNGYRVSIARKGSPKILNPDGTAKFHWVSSIDDKRSYNLGTSYGRLTDIGSPGNTPGAALPVSLSKFRPERLKETGEVVVRWVTESELNNAGFNILRSEKRDKDFTKVHYVAGQGTTSERTVYEWKDKSAKPNVVYYYQIQDVSLDGEVTTLRTTHLRGNVTAAGKATTTWGEIKALQ